MTLKEIKSLVNFMKRAGVASFKAEGVEVVFEKFTGTFELPASPTGEVSAKFDEFKSSLDTHLDARDPKRAAEEYERDLHWST